MPKSKVPSLFELAGKTLENSLFNIGRRFVQKEDSSAIAFSNRIERFKPLLCQIPSLCQHDVAVHCLRAANKLANRYSSKARGAVEKFKIQFAVDQIVSIVTHLKLRRLNFYDWLELVQYSLLNFLWRMTSLQVLDVVIFNSCLKDKEQRLIESFPFLTELVEFSCTHCTDRIIASLCQNCKLIRKVTVDNFSRKVTDESIKSLSRCKNLQYVDFIGVKGGEENRNRLLVKLVITSESNNFCIDECLSFDPFLSQLEAAAPEHLLEVQKLRGDRRFGRLDLIPKYFPHLHELEVTDFCEADLDCLFVNDLKKLELFKLTLVVDSQNFYKVFSLKISSITSLRLHINGDVNPEAYPTDPRINISDVISISKQYPNLESLNFYKCLLVKDRDILSLDPANAFPNLKHFELDCLNVSCADIILKHAPKIEYIVLDVQESITDQFFSSIFDVNPMKQLKKLYVESNINNISAQMLKHIMISCKNLSNLSGFHNTTFSVEVQQFIMKNKLNVEFSHYRPYFT